MIGRQFGRFRLGRPRGRDLDGAELQRLVEELARAPWLWRELIEHDPRKRVYRELLGDDHVTAWLICWDGGHDTGFHDHDASAGAVAVVDGAVHEQRLTLGGPPLQRTFSAGESFHFAARDIHRVRHAGAAPAVTLHAYSPPLRRMGAYEISAEGVLARRPMSYEEELGAPAPA